MSINKTENDELLTEGEAAEYIGMSRAFLCQRRLHGNPRSKVPGPVYLKVGSKVKYLREDLNDWLRQRRIVRNSLN